MPSNIEQALRSANLNGGRAGSTIATSALLPLARVLNEVELDVPRFLATYGLSPAQLEREDARIPFQQLGCIWEHAVSESGDPLVGIRAGMSSVRAGLFKAHEAAGTVLSREAAAEQACARLRSLARQTYCHVAPSDGDVLVVAEGCVDAPVNPLERQQAVEFIVSAASTYVRTFARDGGLRIFFPHERPEGSRDYERALGCEVEFGAPVAGFALTASGADDGAREYRALDSVSSDQLSEISGLQFVARVEVAVAEALRRDGDASLDTLARRLATSSRTLQRRLREHGTSHRDIVERVRARLAVEMFRSCEASITDVARRLGFSDGVAFHRAFKRWTGMTPGTYRERERSIELGRRQ